jgi:RNA polymerase sigma factor (sigma-70 family)
MPARPMSQVVHHLRRAVLLRDGAGLTDGQLLGMFLERREHAAMEALVRRHGAMVWGVCHRNLQNHHDAEDAFQATFLVLVRKASTIMPRDKVANWLYGVANQTARKARATAARRKGREKQVHPLPEAEAAPEELWNDLQPLLDKELCALPDKYRSVLVLCDLEGRTRKDAARQLGVPEGTVAGQLARARAMLAKRLVQHAPTLSGVVLGTMLVRDTASASVPTSVMFSTVKTVTLMATGQAAVLPAQVGTLVQGVINAMLLKKLKIGLVIVLLTMGTAGVGGVGYRVAVADGEANATKAGAGDHGSAALDSGNPRWVFAQEQPHKDEALLNGTWKVTYAMATGPHQLQETSTDQIWVIKDGRITAQFDDGTKSEWSFKLDPSANPPAIDVIWTTGVLSEITAVGVYELKADTLRIHWTIAQPGRRPKSVEPIPTDSRGDRYFGLERIPIEPARPLNTGPPRFQVEHKSPILCVAWSPDGKRVATGTKDGAIAVIEATSGKVLHSFATERPMNAITFTPDGKSLAISFDNSSEPSIWDIETGKMLEEIGSQARATFPAQHIAFSPDGQTLMGIGVGAFYSWTKDGGASATGFAIGSRGVAAVAPDGWVGGWCDANGLCRMYHLLPVARPAIGDTTKETQLQVGPAQSIAFSPGGRVLAVGGDDGAVHLWDLVTEKPITKLAGLQTPATTLAFSADGKTLAAAARDGSSIRVWDFPRNATRCQINLSQGEVGSVALSPDGAILAMSAKEGKVLYFWRAAARQLQDPAATPQGSGPPRLQIEHKAPVLSVAWSPDGTSVASAVDGGVVQISDSTTGKQVQSFKADSAASIGYSPDGKSLATLVDPDRQRNAGGSTVSIWNAETGKLERNSGGVFAATAAKMLAFAPNGQTVIGVGVGSVYRWGGVGSQGLGAGGLGVGFVAIAPDGSAAGWCQPDGKCSFSIYDPNNPKIGLMQLQVGNAHGIAFGPGGKLLAVGSDDKNVHLWDLATKKEAGKLTGLDKPATKLTFSADGKTLAAVAADGSSIRVWDLERNTTRSLMSHGAGEVGLLVLSPDGKMLATTAKDGNVVFLWATAARQLAKIAAPLDLSAGEFADLWSDLANPDFNKADSAWRKLGAAGDNAITMFRERIRAVAVPPADMKRIEKLVTEMDAEKFAVRDKAIKELEAAGEVAIIPLQRVLEKPPSAEARERAILLLKKIKEPSLNPERQRVLEAIDLLEQLKSAKAIKLLQEIERDALIPRIRLEVRQALQRIKH